MARNVVETLIGALVLLIALGFVMFAYKSANFQLENNTYNLTAKFERADGVSLGSDVRIGGIKIGKITRTGLEPKTYLARIDMSINDDIKLPKDSSAQIVSDGLLGGKYVSIIPGNDDEMIKPGEEIKFTQSSVNFETLLGKFMFSNGDDKRSPKTESDSPHEETDAAKKLLPSL